jgi:hypothetical protein
MWEPCGTASALARWPQPGCRHCFRASLGSTIITRFHAAIPWRLRLCASAGLRASGDVFLVVCEWAAQQETGGADQGEEQAELPRDFGGSAKSGRRFLACHDLGPEATHRPKGGTWLGP